MPCDYRLYPDNWKTEIRPRILERDQHKCKFCGLANNIWGYRDRLDKFHEVTGPDAESHGFKIIQVQLGIAHLDHGLTNHADENLAALCRRCHIRYDAPISAPKAAATKKYGPKGRRSKLSLFDPPEETHNENQPARSCCSGQQTS